MQDPNSILSQFSIPEKSYSLTKIDHGLINKSYLVEDSATGKGTYFLQQIDNTIFNDIEGLMNNIEVISSHFDSLDDGPNHLTTLPARDGLNYYRTSDGEYWRLYEYIIGNTFYRAESKKIASEAGKAFGEFQNSLTGIDLAKLQITIPRFHDIDLRYDQFNNSLKGADIKRKNDATGLVKIINENIDYVKSIYHDIVSSCPSRVTHNDTKLSNLLFNNNKEAICVIDYDTLMPGFLPLDFGDSIRTICSTTIEDDPDINNTTYDIELYDSFAASFINALSDTINNAEVKLMASAVAYMPFLMGLRMLTDYLNNDIYYSTNYENHNLDRASNQLTLFMSGVEQLDEMNNIVERHNSNSQIIL